MKNIELPLLKNRMLNKIIFMLIFINLAGLPPFFRIFFIKLSKFLFYWIHALFLNISLIVLFAYLILTYHEIIVSLLFFITVRVLELFLAFLFIHEYVSSAVSFPFRQKTLGPLFVDILKCQPKPPAILKGTMS